MNLPNKINLCVGLIEKSEVIAYLKTKQIKKYIGSHKLEPSLAQQEIGDII